MEGKHCERVGGMRRREELCLSLSLDDGVL